jgi:hypothetical protein
MARANAALIGRRSLAQHLRDKLDSGVRGSFGAGD